MKSKIVEKINKSKYGICILFAILTIVGDYIILPFLIVPFTPKLLVVTLSGVLLGARKGMIAQLIYVGIIISIILLLNGWEGILHVFEYNTGHLVGYVFAAFIIGVIVEKNNKDIVTILIASALGLMTIYMLVLICNYFTLTFYSGESFEFWKQHAVSEAISFFPCASVTWVLTGVLGPKLIPILRKHSITS